MRGFFWVMTILASIGLLVLPNFDLLIVVVAFIFGVSFTLGPASSFIGALESRREARYINDLLRNGSPLAATREPDGW